jgi:hypothetical protein
MWRKALHSTKPKIKSSISPSRFLPTNVTLNRRHQVWLNQLVITKINQIKALARPMEIPKLIIYQFRGQIIIILNKLNDFLPIKTYFQQIKYKLEFLNSD